MKIRSGFVSNSSSSSFCLYGTYIYMTRDELEWLGVFPTATKEDEDLEGVDLFEELHSAGVDAGVEVVNDYESGIAYVGIDPCTIGDDETGSQFKKRALESLKKLFPNIDQPDQAKRHTLEFISETIYG